MSTHNKKLPKNTNNKRMVNVICEINVPFFEYEEEKYNKRAIKNIVKEIKDEFNYKLSYIDLGVCGDASQLCKIKVKVK